MRRYQHRTVAGNCGCCLLPFVILLVAFVATVIVTSLVWHTAAPDIFGWDSPRHHHFDAYRAGFQEGNKVGVEYAAQDRPEPSAEDLDNLARREAEGLRIRRDRRRWMEGFRDGFKRGFERVNKEASSSSRQSRGDNPLLVRKTTESNAADIRGVRRFHKTMTRSYIVHLVD
jgi:hypothetical protein